MMKKISFLAIGSMLFVVSACQHDEPAQPQPDKNTQQQENALQSNNPLQPDSIVVDIYEGHTHVSQDAIPKVGDVFWSNTSNGFHADPNFPNYPKKAIQHMVLTRNNQGEYVPRSEGKNYFMVETSPIDRGVIYAMVMKLYGKGGQRLDLDYKTGELAGQTQVFYNVKRIKPLEAAIPASVVASDTLFTIDEIRKEDKDVAHAMEKEGLKSPLTVYYEPQAKWTSETPVQKAFYFFYQDKPTDERKDVNYLKTPVGFRGVFVNRVPGIAYDVEVAVTVNPDGKPEQAVDAASPTAEQLKHAVLTFSLPFRNVYESRGWGKMKGDERVLKYVYEPKTNYIRYSAVERVFDNRNVYLPVLREFPSFTLEKLRQLYEDDAYSGDSESADFWL